MGILLPYQQIWKNDPSRLKIGMFARQTGKTFTTTLEIVEQCLLAEASGRRDRWVILSRGERQAREAITEGIRRHLEAARGAYELMELDFPGVESKVLEVEFAGGSRVTALPANPDTARGFSANVFLDEFAFHKDSREIWRALFPVISAGWKLRVTSTPNGKGNKFYELMTGEDDAWSRHEVDIYRAVRDGLDRDIDFLRKGLADEDSWAQEYELKWLDEASAWLPYDLISSVEHEDAGAPDGYGGGVCFIGWDVAVRGDLSVMWVLEQVGDVLWTREIVELRRVGLTDQYDELARLVDTYRVGRICIDQTGLGEGAVADAAARYGSVAEGVLLTSANKLVLATGGKQHFEDRTVRIPAGLPLLRADLHKLRRVASATGAPRFVAERDSADHADRTWALFLALHAAADASGETRVDFAGIPRAAAEGAAAFLSGGSSDDVPRRADCSDFLRM